MLLSESKQFIFVHIEKTAGNAIKDYLRKYDSCQQNLFDIVLNKFFHVSFYTYNSVDNIKKLKSLSLGHAMLYVIQQNVSPEIFDNYFKFAFVRNPYSREVSIYEYIKKIKTHPQNELISKLSFPEYLEWRVTKNLRLQFDYIVNYNKEFCLNYLGRFENLDEDFEVCCQKLKIPEPSSLAKVNVTKEKDYDYRDYYDEKAKQLIEKYFQKDLEYLGYDFDGVSKTITPKFPVQKIII